MRELLEEVGADGEILLALEGTGLAAQGIVGIGKVGNGSGDVACRKRTRMYFY